MADMFCAVTRVRASMYVFVCVSRVRSMDL